MLKKNDKKKTDFSEETEDGSLSKPSSTKDKKVSSKSSRRSIVFLFLLTFLASLFFYLRPRLPVWLTQLSLRLGNGRLVTLTNSRGNQEVVRDFRQRAEGLTGEWSFWVVELETRQGYGFYQDDLFTIEDLIGLPGVVAGYSLVERGFLDLNESIELQQADKRLGWGELKNQPAGEEFSLAEVLDLAVAQQDPTAMAMIARRWKEPLERELVRQKLTRWQAGRQSGVEQSLFWSGLVWGEWLGETTNSLLMNSLAKRCHFFQNQLEGLKLTGCQIDFGPEHRHGVFLVGEREWLVILFSTAANDADFYDQANFLLTRVSQVK